MISFDNVFKASEKQQISSHFINILLNSKQHSIPIFIVNNPNLVVGVI